MKIWCHCTVEVQLTVCAKLNNTQHSVLWGCPRFVVELKQCSSVISKWFSVTAAVTTTFILNATLLIFPVRHAEPWETAERSHSSRAAQDSQTVEENPYSGRGHLQVAYPFSSQDRCLGHSKGFKFCFIVSLYPFGLWAFSFEIIEMLKCWCWKQQRWELCPGAAFTDNHAQSFIGQKQWNGKSCSV